VINYGLVLLSHRIMPCASDSGAIEVTKYTNSYLLL